jgi:hypothetical protein
MANVYRTAKGKMIDIDKVKLANEAVVAVGNMKVNARGDLLGGNGQVVAGRNQVMDQVYSVNTDGGYSPNDPGNYNQQQELLEASNARQLNDLVNNSIVPATSAETETPNTPAARGSLADSIAKQTTVTQEPLPTPGQQKKSNGPSRI